MAADKSGVNLEVLEGQELTYEKFEKAVSALPFLGDKRLVIVENLITQNSDSDLKKQVGKKTDHISSQTVLVFVEKGEPDKRDGLFKKLNKPGKVKKFDELIGTKLREWIKKEVEYHKVKISPACADILAQAVGGDLWRLHNEIAKLTLYARSNGDFEIKKEDIKLLVRSNLDPNIFQFVESLGRKDPKKSFALLEDFIKKGENESYLISMIIYQFRNLIIVSELMERGVAVKDVAKEAKMHPFVVKKTAQIAKLYSIKDLKKIYQLLLDQDVLIKSGGVDLNVSLETIVAKLL